MCRSELYLPAKSYLVNGVWNCMNHLEKPVLYQTGTDAIFIHFSLPFFFNFQCPQFHYNLRSRLHAVIKFFILIIIFGQLTLQNQLFINLETIPLQMLSEVWIKFVNENLHL
jgi:hypothetical protein